jgi:hypothetical protein
MMTGKSHRVKASDPGEVVFEATTRAVLTTFVDEFIILGGMEAMEGSLQCIRKGVWIESTDTVPGPAASGRAMPWVLELLRD